VRVIIFLGSNESDHSSLFIHTVKTPFSSETYQYGFFVTLLLTDIYKNNRKNTPTCY